MHEFSIATSIVEAVLEFADKHGVKKVVEVRVLLGELTCIEAEQLKFCFEAITNGSVLEKAALGIETADAVVRCRHCHYEGPPKYWEGARAAAFLPTLACPVCGQTAEAIAGQDCAISSVKFVREDEPQESAA